MVSWGQVLVTVTAAGYLLGRKELPKLAHFVGTYTGRSVGAIIRAKKEFFDATRNNEIVKLQQELQRGIAELNEIRSELTSVGNMNRPLQPQGTAPEGTVTNTAASTSPAHATAAASSAAISSVSFSRDTATQSTVTGATRSSVSLASDYGGITDNAGIERSTEASLAIAELRLAKEGKYKSRIESVEGGADYISASIMDSLLLEKHKQRKD